MSAAGIFSGTPQTAGDTLELIEVTDTSGKTIAGPVTFSIKPSGSSPPAAQVIVSDPANGSTLTSAAHFAATAYTTTCPAGVASMSITVDGNLAYAGSGSSLDADIPLDPGQHTAVVEELDLCGGSSSTPLSIMVISGLNVISNIQTASGNWRSWGELPPAYNICASCPGLTWAAKLW